MPSPVFPAAEEIPALVPQPGSIVWSYAGDARLLATAGYALLLQVAHPTVGAGVSEHSNFKDDPWGRLLRTLDYTYTMVYGGPDLAASMGRRVRAMHTQIKGVKPDGQRYHALEPEAYAWVHATLAEAIITGHRLFGRRMRTEEVERFYVAWRANGRLVGVRERDLPEDWSAFRLYAERMIAERLENNDAVQDVLSAIADPAAPPVPGLGGGVWHTLRFPAVRLLSLATVGLLPAHLRERFGVRWTRAQERELRALAAMSRAATPLMPAALRNVGPRYLRWRREAIAADPRASRRADIRPGAAAPAS
jgi:uncharacterized protein (DUF2236 family)